MDMSEMAKQQVDAMNAACQAAIAAVEARVRAECAAKLDELRELVLEYLETQPIESLRQLRCPSLADKRLIRLADAALKGGA